MLTAKTNKANLLTDSNIFYNPQKKKEEWIFAFLIFVISTPVFIWDWEYFYKFSILFLFLLSLRQIHLSKSNNLLLSCLLWCFSCFCAFRMGSKVDLNAIGYLNIFISFFPFFFIDREFGENIFNKYIIIFSITIIPSLIQYVLVVFAGLEFPFKIIDPSPWNSHDQKYVSYTFFVYMQGVGSIIPRFYGIYDEPGVIGTIAMVLLYTQKYNLKKWYNIPIFLSGILSFSLFFYLSTIIYMISLTNIKNRILIIIIFGVIYFLTFNSQILNELFFSRLKLVFDEGLGLSIRDNYLFEPFYNSLKTKDLLWGLWGNKEVVYAATYKFLFVTVGIIPLSFYLILLLLRTKEYFGISKEMLLYILIPILVFSQRPFINNPFYTFLSIIPLYVMYINKKQNTKNILV